MGGGLGGSEVLLRALPPHPQGKDMSLPALDPRQCNMRDSAQAQVYISVH
jgi:hypothetical protein